MSDKMKHSLPTRIEQRIDVQIAVAQRLKAAAVPAAAPFVTISRQYGCGAIELAEELARRLAQEERIAEDQWQVYSRKIIEDISGEFHLSARLVDALDVRTRGGLEEFFETLVGQAPSDIKVLRALVHTVRALALHGRCVLVGRGGAILTAGLPSGIHVRLVAPESWRLENLVSRFGWDEARAHDFLRQEEGHRQTFFSKYLGKDVSNPLHYDMIFNCASLKREEQIESVAGVFRSRFGRSA